MQQRELQQSPRVSIERERERERLSSSCTRVHENTRGAARRRVVGSMRDADRVIEFHAGGSPLFPRDERGQARKLTARITNSFVDSGADRRRNAEIYRDGDRTGIEWCTRAAREKRDVAPLVFSKPPQRPNPCFLRILSTPVSLQTLVVKFWNINSTFSKWI